jgi:hypothetical protein
MFLDVLPYAICSLLALFFIATSWVANYLLVLSSLLAADCGLLPRCTCLLTAAGGCLLASTFYYLLATGCC